MVPSCIVCDKLLESAFPTVPFEEVGTQPSEGVIFFASGNYGSTIFDPVSYAHYQITINICDGCIVAKQGLITKVVPKRVKPSYEYLPYDPNENYNE